MWNRSWRSVVLIAVSPAVFACSGASGKLPQIRDDFTAEDASLLGTVDGAGSSATSVDDATAAADGAGAADGTALSDARVGPSNPCAGLPVCDDFESTALGQPPRASLWSLNPPGCNSQRGSAVVDTTHAHSGTHSVKVVNDFGPNANPPSYCDHVFFSNASAFASNAPSQVYARFYVYLGNTIDPMNHVSFATMADSSNGGDTIRIGFASDVFVWNRTSDQAFLPELDVGNGMINTSQPGDLSPTSNTWFCFEFHVDEAAGTIETWVDGNAYPNVSENGTPVTDVSTYWLKQNWKPRITSLGLGWESYVGTATDAQTLWIDDVAIAPSRIGCLPN
jgi:hypothetical protein